LILKAASDGIEVLRNASPAAVLCVRIKGLSLLLWA
jgi:hypothetical protein